MFVFPLEEHFHDYGHLQLMLFALVNSVNASLPVSYSAVYSFARNTEHVLAVSRHILWDAEVVLRNFVARWFNAKDSPTFACSTLLQTNCSSNSRPTECHEGICQEGAAAVSDGADECRNDSPLALVITVGERGDARVKQNRF